MSHFQAKRRHSTFEQKFEFLRTRPDLLLLNPENRGDLSKIVGEMKRHGLLAMTSYSVDCKSGIRLAFNLLVGEKP